MSHCLILQTKDKPRRTFGIVKERIVTTQPCSVIEEVQQGGQCGGGLSLCGLAKPKVSYQNLSPCHVLMVDEKVFSFKVLVKRHRSAGFPEGQRLLNEGQQRYHGDSRPNHHRLRRHRA